MDGFHPSYLIPITRTSGYRQQPSTLEWSAKNIETYCSSKVQQAWGSAKAFWEDAIFRLWRGLKEPAPVQHCKNLLDKSLVLSDGILIKRFLRVIFNPKSAVGLGVYDTCWTPTVSKNREEGEIQKLDE